VDELQVEIELLGKLSGKPVVSIAMHNPSLSGEDRLTTQTSLINAYDPRFTRDIAYFSDSCGAWRDATVDYLQGHNIPERLQLLLHPLFWSEQSGNRWKRLETWGNDLRRKLESYEDLVQRVWLSHAGVQEHERRVGRQPVDKLVSNGGTPVDGRSLR
jgi:hypothetical protein